MTMNPYEVYQRRLIYIFGIPDAAHKGLLKIGETMIKNLLPTKKNLKRAAKERIDQYTRTAGIDYNLLHFELAITDDGRTFRDYDVHRLLKKYRHAPKGTKGREWFKIDLQNAIKAIAAVKQGKKFISVKSVREDIIFRPEQETAINKTVEHFKKGGKDFLWNAKMRFGKTFCALEVVRRMNFDKTIIITHRPVVDAGWYDDFNEIFRGTDYIYGNKGSSLEDLLRDGRKFVYFASMQDLRGSETVGGKFDKNDAAFKTKWDLVIVDEAHEGTQTELGDAVIKKLVKKNSKLLDLTGTPFNIFDAFSTDNIFTWDYVMEQRAKAAWDKKNFGDPNPYADLPRMNIFAYDLGKLFNYIDSEDISFSFKEFFRADNERFVHEPDVQSFLNLLVKADDNNYPFSRADFREMFKHTFWIIPGVKEGLALSKLLKRHPVFGKFEIVNVAGDGDPEDKTGEAFAAVRDAIANHEYTITLSCGKLTAGVTVPEWTAVFMLAGSYSTSATSYLQTIFRVQSPCNKGGVSKQNCYVFDFAPDRALRVIAESVKVSTRAGKTKDSQREILGELLNFCPVIAVEGSEMKSLDANRLLQRIKHAQAERAVRNGFEDSNIYNDTLRDLSNIDWKKFDALKKIIGSSKPTKKPADIPVNDQGLTNEQYNDKELTRKPRTPEEKEAARKAAVKRNAISILRGISIRMPFLIYGAQVPIDETITIEKFTEIVDDASWAEFMPAGVTKELFKDFIPYYDPEVFIQAGNIIRQRAKAADKLRPTERINKIAELFATFKNPDKETVLTPWRVVKLHIDSAFAEDFFTPDKKILEINSKTGLYPLYVTHKIFRARLGNVSEDKIPLDELRRLWDMTVADNVFVICKTPMAKTITRRTLLGYRGGSVNAHCFDDLINQLKNKAAQFVKNVTNKNFWNKGAGKMFFDAVVGNPPYQTTTDTGNFNPPVYHLFMEAAFKLCDKVSLIHPARCLFNAGATPQEFRKRLLADPHIKVIRYEPDGKKFFPTSDIKGGVAITLYDKNQTFAPIKVFIPFDELKSIYQKVVFDNPSFRPLSEIVFGRTKYFLTEKFIRDHPNAPFLDRWNDFFKSNVFKYAADYFFDDKPNDGREYIQACGLDDNGKRVTKFIRRDYIDISDNNLNFYKYKVFVPEANGSGALGEVVSTPLVGSPLVGSTQTFISVGAFDTRAEADACIAYIRSKFCRVMLGILKVTQHNPPATWAMVPMQDFNPATSDINWGGAVDEQLYRKYKLTAAEIAFIEDKVRAMA